MKRSSVIAVLSLLFVPGIAYSAQQTTDRTVKQSSVVGTWVGKMDELPAADLVIREDGGKLVGTIVFYRVTDEGNGPKVTGKSELSLIEPKFDGSTLVFSFKRKDGSMTKAQLKLVNDHEAALRLVDEQSAEEGSTVVMVREK